jgi:pimeloyl-ACP methyl ester carboxylesterase
MKTISGSTGATVSYSVAGSGPPLVLVHGAFSNHETNWTFVAPLWQQRFTVYAVARRGRGMTDATDGHALEDEAQDVADLVRSIGAPVYLLGHSYGAHCALVAAAQQPSRVRKLVLYEPVWPDALRPDGLAALETLAAADAWDQLAFAFFANMLHVATEELDALRASDLWLRSWPMRRPHLRTFVRYVRTDSTRAASRVSTSRCCCRSDPKVVGIST